jgi:acetyl esterase
LSPWFVVLPLLAAILVWFAGPRHRRGLRRALGLLALGVALVAVVSVGRMVSTVHEQGVPVSLGAALASHGPVPSVPNHDFVYARFGKEPLGLLIYKPERQRQPQPLAPILMYVHGGGWVEGDRFSGAENMRSFARHGWLAISIDYALSSPKRHLWNRSTEQVACALAWVRLNAGRFGGDVTRISLLGDSAGGNLVLNAAYRANAGELRSSCGGSVPRIAAVSAIYPAVHLAEVYTNKFPLAGDVARGNANAYIGGSPDTFPARYAYVDPVSYISKKAPPTLIIVGENDHLLPPQFTYRFVEEAKRGGVNVELVSFPYGEHLFDQATNSIGNQLVRGATRRFLEKHGQGPTR